MYIQIIILWLFECTYRFSLLFAISFHCLFILNDSFEIREIRWCIYVVILQKGRSIWYQTARHVCFFKKNHIGVTVYLLNSLLLGILSHGYLKDILWVLGYNNFYANIRLALFKRFKDQKQRTLVLGIKVAMFGNYFYFSCKKDGKVWENNVFSHKTFTVLRWRFKLNESILSPYEEYKDYAHEHIKQVKDHTREEYNCL